MEDLMRMALSNALCALALAAAAALIAPALRRRPAVMHAVWTLVLLKLVTPPLLELPIGRLDPGGEPEEAAMILVDEMVLGLAEPEPASVAEVAAFDPPADPAVDESPARWSIDATTARRTLVWLWAGGMAAAAITAIRRIARFQRGLREALPAEPEVEDEVATLSLAMGFRRPPRVVFLDARIAPMLWAPGRRAQLVLPLALWKGMDARRRTLLLAHELAHLKRGDHRVRLLELAATVAYWWFPAIRWISASLRDVEEQCCDAWVVWMFPDDARAYAETLMDTVDFLHPDADPTPLLASGFGGVRHLRRRLTMVMKGETPRSLGTKGTLAALTLAGLLLPIGPAWARRAPEEGATTTAVTIGVRSEDGDKPLVERRVMIGVDSDDPAAVGAGIRKAMDNLRDRIKELESLKPARDGDSARLDALRSALESLEKMAAKGPSAIELKSDGETEIRHYRPGRVVAGRPNLDDPKFAEARKRVEALQKELAEKQREIAETAKKLSEAHREMARIAGAEMMTLQLREVMPGGPRIAEGRALLRQAAPSEEKARIDALERKLDQVLQRLEGLKQPDSGEKK